MLTHSPCAWVRTRLSGVSSSHFLALLGYLEQADPDLPPRGGSAAATGVRMQERGQGQPLHKIFRFPAEILLNTVRAPKEADRRSPYAPGRARLPRVPRSGSGRWARSRVWVNYGCFRSLSFTFWSRFSFHMLHLQNYLIGLLKNPPAYQFTLLTLSQHIT